MSTETTNKPSKFSTQALKRLRQKVSSSTKEAPTISKKTKATDLRNFEDTTVFIREKSTKGLPKGLEGEDATLMAHMKQLLLARSQKNKTRGTATDLVSSLSNHALQALEDCLVLEEKLPQQDGFLKAAENNAKTLEEKNKELKETTKENEQLKRQLQKTSLQLLDEKAKAEEEIKVLKESLQKMKDKFLEAITYCVLQGRLEAMTEHAEGKADKWNVTVEKAEFEEMYKGKDVVALVNARLEEVGANEDPDQVEEVNSMEDEGESMVAKEDQEPTNA